MAVQSNLKNMALCLTAVCLVCAAILGGTYALTKGPIEAAAQEGLVAGISEVLPKGGELSECRHCDAEGIDGYYVLSANGVTLAYAFKSTTTGFGGNLVLMVGVLADGTVYNTSVLDHSETPGLGAKCDEAESHFRTQFQGFKGDLRVKKDGGDIDAITASTITSRAFAKAVQQAVNAAKVMEGEKPEYDAASGASQNSH